MFKEGDYVVYGISGVYQVKAVGIPDLPIVPKNKPYYTLIPLSRTGEKIYTPVDTKVFMRPVITRREANNLVQRIPSISGEDWGIKDTQWLTVMYEDAFFEYNCEALIKLIKTIYIKNRQTLIGGKKLNQLDHNCLKQAEKLLISELSFALELTAEEVECMIEDRLKEKVKLESS